MTSADAVPLIKDASHMSQGSYKLTQNRSHTHSRHSALQSSNRAKLTSLRHGTTTLRATHTPPRAVCTHTTSHHNTAPGATRDTVSGASAYHWMQSDPTHNHGRSAHAGTRDPPSHNCHMLWRLRTRRLREEPNILNMSFRSRRWLGVPRPCDVLELDESESLPVLVSLLPERVVERERSPDGSLVSSIWEPGKLPSSTAPLPLRLAPCWRPLPECNACERALERCGCCLASASSPSSSVISTGCQTPNQRE